MNKQDKAKNDEMMKEKFSRKLKVGKKKNNSAAKQIKMNKLTTESTKWTKLRKLKEQRWQQVSRRMCLLFKQDNGRGS